jgi:hypothetical protein
MDPNRSPEGKSCEALIRCGGGGGVEPHSIQFNSEGRHDSSSSSSSNHHRPFLIILGIIPLLLQGCAAQSLSHLRAHGHDHKHKHAHPGVAAQEPAGGTGKGAGSGASPLTAVSDVKRPVEFDEGFAATKEFYVKNGHSKIPQAAVGTRPDGSEFSLGKWVQLQRQKFKNTYTTPGKRPDLGMMTDAERAKLTSVSFLFTTPPELVKPPPMDWEVAFTHMEDFYKKHKHTKVPEKTMLDNGQGGTFDLGKWRQRQRQLYKNTFVTPGQRKGFGKLSEDRKKKLEGIKFDFDE